VEYHQYWLGDSVTPDVATLYANDLPGARPLVALDDSGRLACVHTGMYGFDLPLTVQVWPHRPEPDLTGWEEVLEFSLRLEDDTSSIQSLARPDGGLTFAPPDSETDAQAGTEYRVRLHTTGRQQATDVEHVSLSDEGEAIEQHLIQLWAEPAKPAQWLKELNWPTWTPDAGLPHTDFIAETRSGQ
jgi:hypothetical protein